MLTEACTSVAATPILDDGVLPSRRRPKRSIARKILGFVFGLVLGVSFPLSVDQAKSAGLNGAFGPIFVIAAIVLAVTVHELGHLAAGRVIGFHFKFISIGPFTLGLEHGALKIHIRRDMGAAGYAGMNADGVRRLRYRSIIFLSAGPAANLLSIPTTILLVDYAVPGLKTTWVSLPTTLFVIISLLLGVLNLMPLGLDSPSDGSRIAMLLRSREHARRWISNMAMCSQMQKTIRPRYWRKTWLQTGISLRDASPGELSSNYLAYMAANDRKDESKAADYLERCLELSWLARPTVRDMIAKEAAVFTAWFREDAVLADKWVTQIEKPKLILPLLKIRLAIALAAGHRDFATVLNHWQEGFEFIGKLPMTPERERLIEGWLEWQAEIQERQRTLKTEQEVK